MSVAANGELRLTRRWADVLLEWSDDPSGYICVFVSEQGEGRWYATDGCNLLHLDGREKAGHGSMPSAGPPGVYVVPRLALARGIAEVDALAKLGVHPKDDVRCAPEYIGPTEDGAPYLGAIRSLVQKALREEPAPHGHLLPYETFRRFANLFADCNSMVGARIDPVHLDGRHVWRLQNYGRIVALVAGCTQRHRFVRRWGPGRPALHPTARTRVLADTVEVATDTPSGKGTYLLYFHCGDLDEGEEIVVDEDGCPWIVPAEVEGGAS